MSTQAVVAGHVCLDVIPQVDHPVDLAPGRLYFVGPPTTGTGGPVSNTGVCLHILGIKTMLMGKIGDDNFGQAIIDIFKRYSPDLVKGMIRVPGETTSYSVVLNIPGRDRTFLHCPGANDTFVAKDVAYDKVAKAPLFHLGYPPLMAKIREKDGAELVKIYRKVKGLGVTTSLDMAMPDPDSASGKVNWQKVLRTVCPHVDIFLPSADELLFMIDRKHYGQGDNIDGAHVAKLGQALLDLGVAIAGVKLGARGIYVRTAGKKRLQAMGRLKPASLDNWADRELWFPIFQVKNFVGATGAGDTTIAGFLAALLRGLPIEEAGVAANLVGAMNVQAADALSALRSWEDTLAQRRVLKPATLDPRAPGWRQDPKSKVWHGPRDRQGA
jgi:sugar/nucleoside kinase (ribokinase family)